MWKKGKERQTKEGSYIIEQMKNWDFQKEVSDLNGKESLYEMYNNYKEYFTEFKNDFNHVQSKSAQLEAVIEEVVEVSDNVNASTQHIAKGSQAQLDDVSRCMEVADVLSNKVESMEDKSKKLIELAYEMNHENQVSKDTIHNLLINQEKNHEVISKITDNIYELVDKTNKINEITQVLYSIAAQTNLLALNASIEAARAGEAGRGFSVVAEEVRKLSEESRFASQHINDSIVEIVGELDGLKKVINESGVVFQAQTKSVEKVVESSEKISGTVDIFIDKQKEFNNEVKEVSMGKEILIESIRNIATVGQEAFAITEEVASLTIGQRTVADTLLKISADICNKINLMNKYSAKIKINSLDKKRKKIAMIWDLESPFWDPATKEAHKAAKVFDFEISIFAPKVRGDQGTKQMLGHLEEVIEQKYDAIVISPITNEKITQVLKKATNQGIKIIFLQSVVEGVPYEALIGTNGFECGINAARVAKRLLNNEGQAVIGMWADNKLKAIEERAQGFIKELQQNSDIKVIQTDVVGEPSESKAEDIIREMLRKHPNIDLVYATNVGWGMAYAKYVSKYHPNIKVVTVDFTKDIASHIHKGNIDIAIAQRPFIWGSKALEILVDVFNGKSLKASIDTGTYEVNAKNIAIFENRF